MWDQIGKRITALCCVLLICFGLGSCADHERTDGKNTDVGQDSIGIIDTTETTDISETTRVQDPALTSEVSVGYLNEDGTRTIYVYSQAINYLNEYRQWVPINTAIKEVDEQRMADNGYAYTVAASDIVPYYPKSLSEECGIRLQKNVYQFGVVSDKSVDVKYSEKDNFIGEHKEMLLYPGAVNGSDMYVYPSSLGTNVEIDVKQPFEKNKFQLWLKVENSKCNVVKQPGGYLTIEITENGETNTLGVIQKPVIRTEQGEYSYGGAISSVKKSGTNDYLITFSVDEAVNQKNANVFIAFEIRREKLPDNCLYSKKPNLDHAFLCNYSVIGSSDEYGIGRLMLRYSLTPFGIDAHKVVSATYELYALSHIDAVTELVPVLEDWCSITGNWNSNYQTGEPICQCKFDSHIWRYDITDSVKAWLADDSTQLEHNGLQLRYVDETDDGSILLSNDNSLFMNVIAITFTD